MNIPSSPKISALGLALSFGAFAQNPAPMPRVPRIVPTVAPALTSQQLPTVTESSRVSSFHAGPDGETRSLYLQNGSVVDPAPGLGGQLGPVVRKGQKITVTGTNSVIKGQSLVEAVSVQLNDQTFAANASAPGPLAEGVTLPPPVAPQAPPAPAPLRRSRAAAPAPCGATIDTPLTGTGLSGPPPLPPGFEAGPPSPPPSGAAPAPPPDGNAPPRSPRN